MGISTPKPSDRRFVCIRDAVMLHDQRVVVEFSREPEPDRLCDDIDSSSLDRASDDVPGGFVVNSIHIDIDHHTSSMPDCDQWLPAWQQDSPLLTLW